MESGYRCLQVMFLCGDVVSAVLSLYITSMLHLAVWQWWPKSHPFITPLRFTASYMAGYVLIMFRFPTNAMTERLSKRPGLSQVTKISTTAFVMVEMILVLWDAPFMAYVTVGLFILGHCLLSHGVRRCVRLVVRRRTERGFPLRYVLLIGDVASTRDWLLAHPNYQSFGMRIVGIVTVSLEQTGPEIEGVPILGQFGDVTEVLYKVPADEVWILTSWERYQFQSVLRMCEVEGKAVHVMPEAFSGSGNTKVSNRNTPTVWSICTIPQSWAWIVKRCLDIVCSSAALVLLSPLFVVIALSIKLSSKGPVLFVQERLGYHGRRIHILKFRTMVLNAEQLKENLLDMNEMDGPVFKIQADPRITSVGRVLRALSLDELPQLVNVLKGEMSLVGPRPLPTAEALECVGLHRKRMAVRPGLTGLWQVSGRNRLTYEEWMRLDIQYIENWNLWLDFQIILRTIPEVLGRGGM